MLPHHRFIHFLGMGPYKITQLVALRKREGNAFPDKCFDPGQQIGGQGSFCNDPTQGDGVSGLLFPECAEIGMQG